jgi:hypothetical protein
MGEVDRGDGERQAPRAVAISGFIQPRERNCFRRGRDDRAGTERPPGLSDSRWGAGGGRANPRSRHGSRAGDSNPAKQVGLWRLIQFDKTKVVPLDGSHAQAIGAQLARTRTSDIVYAHIVICAQMAGYAVITSDPFDLRRLDPKLRVIAV